MKNLKVVCEVEIYKIDTEDCSITDTKTLKVLSHWNSDEFVVLDVGGKKYSVLYSELRKAIDNATNTMII